MLGLELVRPEAEPDGLGARPPAPELARAVQREALARGLIVETGGRYGCVVRLLPPLTMSDEQANAVLERLDEALTAAAAAAPPLPEPSSPRSSAPQVSAPQVSAPQVSAPQVSVPPSPPSVAASADRAGAGR